MGFNILLVDDSLPMRRLMGRVLEAAGLPRPAEAADGDDALAQFSAGKFDLVVTDMMMPRKNGIEVVEAMRRQDPDVTLVILTTEADPSYVEQAKAAGANEYLLKPFAGETRSRLLTLCQEQLNARVGAA